jgi:hypothetical protein
MKLRHIKPIKPTGCFLRSGGHPELTVQECGDAEDEDHAVVYTWKLGPGAMSRDA